MADTQKCKIAREYCPYLNSLINDFTTKCSMRNMQIIIIVEKIFIKNP